VIEHSRSRRRSDFEPERSLAGGTATSRQCDIAPLGPTGEFVWRFHKAPEARNSRLCYEPAAESADIGRRPREKHDTLH
jgi:hypothetical protein